MVRNNEVLQRLADKAGNGGDEENVDDGNLLSDILDWIKEQSEAYEARLAERVEAEPVKEAAAKADLAGESAATGPSATTPAVLDFRTYAAPTLAATRAATTTVQA